MRMSALRQLPPLGSYVNGDEVLLARMSFARSVLRSARALFVGRHHGGQSIRTLPVRLQQPRRFRLTSRYPAVLCPEWWDPAKTRALAFPEFRQFCLLGPLTDNTLRLLVRSATKTQVIPVTKSSVPFLSDNEVVFR
jgi:hypothetical protein